MWRNMALALRMPVIRSDDRCILRFDNSLVTGETLVPASQSQVILLNNNFNSNRTLVALPASDERKVVYG